MLLYIVLDRFNQVVRALQTVIPLPVQQLHESAEIFFKLPDGAALQQRLQRGQIAGDILGVAAPEKLRTAKIIDGYVNAADFSGGKLFHMDVPEQRLEAPLGNVRLSVLHSGFDLLEDLDDLRHGLLIDGGDVGIAYDRLLGVGVIRELSGLLGLLRRIGQRQRVRMVKRDANGDLIAGNASHRVHRLAAQG